MSNLIHIARQSKATVSLCGEENVSFAHDVTRDMNTPYCPSCVDHTLLLHQSMMEMLADHLQFVHTLGETIQQFHAAQDNALAAALNRFDPPPTPEEEETFPPDLNN